MITVKNIKRIEDYQLRELETNKLYINKYDLDLKYEYEMNVHWKEFFFDLLQEMATKDIVYLEKQDNLLKYLKEDYKTIKKIWNLKTDIKDYIELTDYITLQEWENTAGNFLIKTNKDFFLLTIEN